uniref:Uncharacterized protein n=1 Tax=viral metagenome TaxID=1070528 RepID=A0A6C0IKM7_9ZZZZ
MDILRLRFFLFLFGCIGSRIAFTVLSAYSTGVMLQFLGMIAILFVIGWIYIIFIGKRDTGPEVFGGKIWWQKLRPVHAILWGLFAFLALSKNPKAWMVLAADTSFGLLSFLRHHYMNGDLKMLL